MYIDVFNGDADGLCALHQLRLADPVDSELVTGIKRDINLLSRVSAADGDFVTVLDVSLDKNREGLIRLLDSGAQVRYFDHHFVGEIPESDNLQVFIDTDSAVCTSILVNQFLDSRYLPWAVTAAFGDNLYDSARNIAAPLDLSEAELEKLKILGTCLNYNGYGASLDDLFYHPADLFKKIQPYENPLDFISSDDAYETLFSGYTSDLVQAKTTEAQHHNRHAAVFILPDEKWARRVSGIYGNELAQQVPDRAHAILTRNGEGYQVSVRAPLANRVGADTLCRQFDTGGGRKAAAGINYLPASDADHFVSVFLKHFSP